jgi:nucleotide-binding universal stress UspA family protein
MKILLAADGSPYTKKALAWLTVNQTLGEPGDELIVLNVQPPLPPRARSALGADVVKAYHHDEAAKVTAPIEKFLKRHKLPARVISLVGVPAEEILRVAQREKVHQIVMGTHGRGVLGRALMGSVAQRVVSGCTVPVLLVK